MGIKNLRKFLKTKHPQLLHSIHLQKLRYKKVAIDTSLFMYKFKATAGKNWIGLFINMITCLRSYNIHCVFIYDGQAPPQKIAEQNSRRETRENIKKTVEDLETELATYHATGSIGDTMKRIGATAPVYTRLLRRASTTTATSARSPNQKINIAYINETLAKKKSQVISINPDDYNITSRLFEIFDVPFYTAPEEAEKFCSKLCIDGKVDAVLSDDTDVLAYGTPLVLTNLDVINDQKCIAIAYEDVLATLGFTHAQFLDLCIMAGTDYNKNMPSVGIHNAHAYIKKYKSIENVQTETKHDTSVLKYETVRTLFRNYEDDKYMAYTTPEFAIPYCGQPNWGKLEQFFSENKFEPATSVSELAQRFETFISHTSDTIHLG